MTNKNSSVGMVSNIKDQFTHRWFEVAYSGGHVRQNVDIITPNGSGPFKLVVLVHGGGGALGSSRVCETMPYSNDFFYRVVARGYACANLNYRLANVVREMVAPGTGHLHPASKNDLLACISYLRTNAATYDIDPDNVVIAGFSHGGQMVLLAAADLATGNDWLKVGIAASPGTDNRLTVPPPLAGCPPETMTYIEYFQSMTLGQRTIANQVGCWNYTGTGCPNPNFTHDEEILQMQNASPVVMAADQTQCAVRLYVSGAELVSALNIEQEAAALKAVPIEYEVFVNGELAAAHQAVYDAAGIDYTENGTGIRTDHADYPGIADVWLDEIDYFMAHQIVRIERITNPGQIRTPSVLQVLSMPLISRPAQARTPTIV